MSWYSQRWILGLCRQMRSNRLLFFVFQDIGESNNTKQPINEQCVRGQLAKSQSQYIYIYKKDSLSWMPF